MSFTYSNALSADRDKVRLRIGDTVSDKGPRPDGRNFSDEELDFVLSDEGSVNGAIAHAFEILANEWESFSISEREGEVSYDAKNKAADFDKRAERWRQKAGGGLDTIYVGTIQLDYQQTDTTLDYD